MINNVYQLVAPRTVAVKFEEIDINNRVIVKPLKMALCHADQRYFQGKRSPEVMRNKLPMALIHECMGEVLHDPLGKFSVGEKVALIPNVPGDQGNEIYENYAEGSRFLSSGCDGFMREVVDLPHDRIVSCEGVEPRIAAISEFVSVAVHAAARFDSSAHGMRRRIAIVGDGSLGFTVSSVLAALFPQSELIVVGHSLEKLSLFTHAAERYIESDLPCNLSFDHAFECAGGEGSARAIELVIRHIRPQGTLVLMGVSEHPVPVYTRDVLEKGLSVVGCSRSGRSDFETAIEIMRNDRISKKLSQIIYEDEPVNDIKDIKRVFTTDVSTPFKTVFQWNL